RISVSRIASVSDRIPRYASSKRRRHSAQGCLRGKVQAVKAGSTVWGHFGHSTRRPWRSVLSTMAARFHWKKTLGVSHRSWDLQANTPYPKDLLLLGR